MHVYFVAARRGRGQPGDTTVPEALDADQIHVVRDPDDESEWQYLGNPEIAARTSLREVVGRFLQDCQGEVGHMDPVHVPVAAKLRDALLAAARQVDAAIATAPAPR